MLEIKWVTPGSHSREGQKCVVDERISVLSKDFKYICSVMHMGDALHFYPLVSYDGRIWGPPSEENGTVKNWRAKSLHSLGRLPYVTKPCGGYSLLHCYVAE
jgi:hypothetical protein